MELVADQQGTGVLPPKDSHKHFLDFNPTEAEIRELTGGPLDDEQVTYFEGLKVTDSEKWEIAKLMFHCGHPIIARRWSMTIKNDLFREDVLLVMGNWAPN